ncbi:head-tail adaptor protein [Rhodobacteraceae bacterium SC52]|nr:head-tail adaptor protein [Rhodobacteraceae bacterium SC52]
MKRSQLRWLVTLEEQVVEPDGAGGNVSVWRAKGAHYACLEPLTGRELLDGAAGVSRVPFRVTVAGAPYGAPSRPHPKDRFRHGTRIFDIIAVSEADPAGRFVECRAIEEVTV